MVKQVSMKSLRHVRKIDDISKYYTWKTQLGAGKFGIVHEAVRVRTGGTSWTARQPSTGHGHVKVHAPAAHAA